MREAVLTAPVGDDVMGEDPTVNSLEKRAALLLGKEAALFTPTGCMANTLALAAHCNRGDELIAGSRSHIFNWEAGAAAALLGVAMQPVPTAADGTLQLRHLAAAVRPDDPHCAVSRLVCLENTHNMCGGRVLPAEYMQKVGQLCRELGLKLHVDGARIANAAVALGMPLAELLQPSDTVSMCLSKGLGAPLGSVLAGSEAFIRRARRLRKQLGGGMRQVGYVAAAGHMALDNVDRLAEDHVRAKRLAEGVVARAGGVLELVSPVDTNIVLLRIRAPGAVSPAGDDAGTTSGCSVGDDATREHGRRAQAFIARLRHEHGVLLGQADRPGLIRAVTHLDVDDGAVEAALNAMVAVAADMEAGLSDAATQSSAAA
jgi:threonine aldolase